MHSPARLDPGGPASAPATLLTLAVRAQHGDGRAFGGILGRLDVLSFAALRGTCHALHDAVSPEAMRHQLARLAPPPPGSALRQPVRVALAEQVGLEASLRAGRLPRFRQVIEPLADGAFCGDERFVLVAGGDGQGTLSLVDLCHFGPAPASADVQLRRAGERPPRLATRLSGDGRWLVWLRPAAQGRQAAEVSILDLRSACDPPGQPTETQLDVVPFGAGAPRILFSPAAAHLAISRGGAQGAMELWDLRAATPLRVSDMPALADLRGPAAFSPEGSCFAVAAQPTAGGARAAAAGDVALWPLGTGQRGPAWLRGGPSRPHALVVSREGETVVLLGDREMRVWWRPLGRGCASATVALPRSGAGAAARSLPFPGRLLLSWGDEEDLWVAELRGVHVDWLHLGHNAQATVPAAGGEAPIPWDDRWLLARGAGGEAAAVDVGAPRLRRLRLPDARAPLRQAAFSSLGGECLLLTLSADLGAALWQLPAAAERARRLASPAWGTDVSALCWLPRAGWAATGHADGHITLWPPDARGPGDGLWPAGDAGVRLFRNLPGPIERLSVSATGRWLLATISGSSAAEGAGSPYGRVFKLYGGSAATP